MIRRRVIAPFWAALLCLLIVSAAQAANLAVRGCPSGTLKHALEETTLALAPRSVGSANWFEHSILHRAMAEEVLAHGAKNPKEVGLFLGRISRLPKSEQERIADGVFKRVSELVSVSNAAKNFKAVEPFARKLGVSVDDYDAFVASWRAAISDNPEQTKKTIQSLLIGQKGDQSALTVAVVDQLPSRKWTTLGLTRDKLTEGTGKPKKLSAPAGSHDERIAVLWEKIPVAQKAAPFIVEKHDFIGKFNETFGKDLKDEAIVNAFRAEPASFTFVKVSLDDGPRAFRMGSEAAEAGRHEDEIRRVVTLTKSYEIQGTPVTRAQWKAVMRNDPSTFKEGSLNAAVETVNYVEVQQFMAKLNQADSDYHYRLPTEAEWEFAARAGSDTTYASYKDLTQLKRSAWSMEHSGGKPQEVGLLEPNAWGLRGMYGYTWEWTGDWYERSPAAQATDPVGPSSGSSRVMRGGSWNGIASFPRSASRYDSSPGHRSYSVGFRVVRTRRN